MNLNDLSTVWVLIKPSIEDGDPREAADLLVNHLIDDGISSITLERSAGLCFLKQLPRYVGDAVSESVHVHNPALNTLVIGHGQRPVHGFDIG